MVGARFPVSRQGSKSGYSDAIKGALCLHDAPDAFLWVEPDQELARTLALLTTPGGPQAVAEVIRSWIGCPAGHKEGDALTARCAECCPEETESRQVDGEWIGYWISTGKQDARRLWERLRKERPETSPEREAGLLYMQTRQRQNAAVCARGEGYGATHGDAISTVGYMPEEHEHPDWSTRGVVRPALARNLSALPVARHLVLSASNRLIHATTHPDGRWANTGNGGTRYGGEFATSPADVAARVEDVAGWMLVSEQTRPSEANARELGGGGFKASAGGTWPDKPPDAGTLARRAAATPTMPPVAVLCCGAEEVDPAAVLEAYGVEGAEVVAYMDGPYHGRCEDDGTPVDGSTTGYLHKFGRKEQLEVAHAWDAAGVTVVISECVPLCGTMKRLHGGDWWSIEITDCRRGQKRSFSTARGRTEWLTMNRPPVPRAAWPARDALPGQPSLFGS